MIYDEMRTAHSSQAATISAGDRFFRTYQAHCLSPDTDTLFNLLNALHSMNDKLRKAHNRDLFSLKEFVALKALRNLFHHQDELLNDVRVLVVQDLPSISTDQIFVCLAPRALVEIAISGIELKRRKEDGPMAREALKWYGNVVNLNPCIFNLAVHIYEIINEIDLPLSSNAYFSFRERYEFEECNGYSHFITGDISCLSGDVEAVLKVAFADVA